MHCNKRKSWRWLHFARSFCFSLTCWGLSGNESRGASLSGTSTASGPLGILHTSLACVSIRWDSQKDPLISRSTFSGPHPKPAIGSQGGLVLGGTVGRFPPAETILGWGGAQFILKKYLRVLSPRHRVSAVASSVIFFTCWKLKGHVSTWCCGFLPRCSLTYWPTLRWWSVSFLGFLINTWTMS